MGKLFPLYPYLEGDPSELARKRQRSSISYCKLLPRDAVHINPRLLFSRSGENICAFIYLSTYTRTYAHIHAHIGSSRLFTPTTTTGDEEEAPSGRSRLYARPLCAVWPRMGNEGIGGMRSLDTEPTPDVAKQNMAPRDNPASAKRTQESAQCICITPRVLAESC